MNTAAPATTERAPWTPAHAATLAGLVAAAAGIGALRAAGVAMPAVPPGAVLLLVAAALVAGLRRNRWPAAAAALVGLAEVVAGGAGVGDLVADDSLVIVGTALRIVGGATAVVGGALMWRAARRPARATA